MLTFSMFLSFSTFTPPFPMAKNSWEWYKPLLFKFGFLDLDLVTVHLHWVFFFYNHSSSNSQLIPCPFHFAIQPLTNQVINLLVICQVSLIFQYKVSISFFAYGRIGLVVLKVLTWPNMLVMFVVVTCSLVRSCLGSKPFYQESSHILKKISILKFIINPNPIGILLINIVLWFLFLFFPHVSSTYNMEVDLN